MDEDKFEMVTLDEMGIDDETAEEMYYSLYELYTNIKSGEWLLSKLPENSFGRDIFLLMDAAPRCTSPLCSHEPGDARYPMISVAVVKLYLQRNAVINLGGGPN